MGKQWFKASVCKPPVNVPVLCRLQWYHKYELSRKNKARYHYEVRWIMEDGDWCVAPTLYRIVEWQYIVYDNKQVGVNDDFTAE